MSRKNQVPCTNSDDKIISKAIKKIIHRVNEGVINMVKKNLHYNLVNRQLNIIYVNDHAVSTLLIYFHHYQL